MCLIPFHAWNFFEIQKGMIFMKATKTLMLLLVAMLLFALAACGRAQPSAGVTTTAQPAAATENEPASSGETPNTGTQASSLPSAVSGDTTLSAVSASSVPLTTPGGSTATGAQTTDMTKKVPQTKAELVAYFNQLANRVKAEKPGYTMQEQISIGEPKSSSGALEGVAKVAIPMFNQDAPKNMPSVSKGADHSQFGAYAQSYGAKLTPAMVKNISLTDKGTQYVLRVEMKDEVRPALPKDNGAEHDHGKVFKVFSYEAVYGTINDLTWLFTMEKFAPTYHGSYVIYTIDKATDRVRHAEYMMRETANCQAKMKIGSSFTATCDISMKGIYTIN